MIAELIVQHELANPATLSLVSATYSVNSETTGQTTGVQPSEFRVGDAWRDATANLHDPYRYEGYFEDVLLTRFQRLQPEWVIDLSLEQIASWSLPVCIIHGDQDEFFPVEIPRQMDMTLPDSELHIIEGQGHGLIFRKPGRVGAILSDFLARHPSYAPYRV